MKEMLLSSLILNSLRKTRPIDITTHGGFSLEVKIGNTVAAVGYLQCAMAVFAEVTPFFFFFLKAF